MWSYSLIGAAIQPSLQLQMILTPGQASTSDLTLGSNSLGYALSLGGAAPMQVTFSGQFASASNPGAGWHAIAATPSGSGYSLYWQNANASQFARWNLNSTGALVSGNVLSPVQFFQEESTLGLDLNRDGITGLSYTAGTATIENINLGTTAGGYALRRGSEAPLAVTISGQQASATNPGAGWRAIAATPSGAGYSLYWQNANASQFARWNLNSTGALVSGNVLNPVQFFQEESTLGLDLNRDGTTGLSYTAGTATISGVNLGSSPLGYALRRGNEDPLQITFSGYYVSESNPGGGWLATAAIPFGSGYKLFWTNAYFSHNAISYLTSTGVGTSINMLSSTQLAREEITIFADLNQDRRIGNPSPTRTPSYEEILRTGFGTSRPGTDLSGLGRTAFVFNGREWVSRGY